MYLVLVLRSGELYLLNYVVCIENFRNIRIFDGNVYIILGIILFLIKVW